MAITYELISGDLPPGIETTPDGKLTGSILYGERPTWTTPEGRLGVWDEMTPITVTLEVEAPVGRSIVAYQTTQIERGRDAALPWGLSLDGTTGVLSGTAQEVIDPFATPYLDTEIPLFVQPAGSLGTVDELTAVTLEVEATPQLGTATTTYWLVDGWLPPGLVLDPVTGAITGTAPEEFGLLESKTPQPRWNTAPGRLGMVNEFASFTTTVSATALLGTAISTYTVIDGSLPWGLVLNPLTGVIAGTAAEIKDPDEPPYIVPGGPGWQTASGSLGTFAHGAAVNLTLAAQPIAGRTLAFYSLWSETVLPLGLVLNRTTGAVTGTVSTQSPLGETSFSIAAFDSAGARSVRTFSITVS